jgi:putative NADPH-quinone reductase
MRGKKGLLITSVGGPNEWYTNEGLQQQTFDERMIHVTCGVFNFCGWDAL